MNQHIVELKILDDQVNIIPKKPNPFAVSKGVWRPQLPHGFARRAQTIINIKGSCGTYEFIIYQESEKLH
jgi:hypothetical protein